MIQNVNVFCTILIFLVLFIGIIDVLLLIKYRTFVRYLVSRHKSRAARVIQKDWSLLADGESGNIQLEIEWLRTAQKAYTIFKRKNHDYGTENLATGWIPGIAIRLGDKVSRVWTLLGLRGNTTRKVSDESLADSFLDIGNYGLVAYIMTTGGIARKDIDATIGAEAISTLLKQD